MNAPQTTTQRRWLIGLAVGIGFLIISWRWKSATHTCETCGSTRTSTSAQLLFWQVYSKEEATTLPVLDDHQHDWQLTVSNTRGGPLMWLLD